MTDAVFAIGDIHGRLDLLDPLLLNIFSSPLYTSQSRIVFLGDYVDRGPFSAGVIDRLIELPKKGVDRVCLAGNHDLWFLHFIEDPIDETNWLQWGGVETAASYGVQAGGPIHSGAFRRAVRDQLVKKVPKAHLDFIRSMPTHHVALNTLFVHAGVKPGVALDDQKIEDLTYIRGEFLNDRRPHEYFVVHGHTAVMEPDIRDNRANIDTGAYATNTLSCLIVTADDRQVLQRSP